MVSGWPPATLLFSWARDAGKYGDRRRIAVAAISTTRLNVLRPRLRADSVAQIFEGGKSLESLIRRLHGHAQIRRRRAPGLRSLESQTPVSKEGRGNRAR